MQEISLLSIEIHCLVLLAIESIGYGREHRAALLVLI